MVTLLTYEPVAPAKRVYVETRASGEARLGRVSCALEMASI